MKRTYETLRSDEVTAASKACHIIKCPLQAASRHAMVQLLLRISLATSSRYKALGIGRPSIPAFTASFPLSSKPHVPKVNNCRISLGIDAFIGKLLKATGNLGFFLLQLSKPF